MAYLRGYGDAASDLASGFATGAATGAVLAFNSTKYPGTCKPSNTYTLELFKSLQRQLNRVAQLQGLTKIAIDGDIGPGTVALANKTIGAPASCTQIANAVGGYTQQAKIMADNGGAPTSVSSPPSPKPQTLVDAAGTEILAPSSGIAGSIADAFANMSSTQKVLGLAILGGVGYMLTKKPRSKARRGR